MSRAERLVHIALGLLAAATFAVLYAPIVLVCVLSFFPVARHKIDWASFSIDAYAQLFQNEDIFHALVNTLIVGSLTVIITLVAGTVLAWRASQKPGRSTQIVEFAIFLPFLLPPIITGLSLLTFFQQIGVDRSLVTVTFGHILFVLALVYRMILNRLRALGGTVIEASRDLGASSWQTFRYVVFPGLRPALITGAVLAFALSFDETLITIFLGGGEQTLPIRLWAMMRIGFSEDINALVTLVLIGSIAMTILAAVMLRSRNPEANS
jgi:ABC-type spermidine/putrescine transport system permease subunit II